MVSWCWISSVMFDGDVVMLSAPRECWMWFRYLQDREYLPRRMRWHWVWDTCANIWSAARRSATWASGGVNVGVRLEGAESLNFWGDYCVNSIARYYTIQATANTIDVSAESIRKVDSKRLSPFSNGGIPNVGIPLFIVWPRSRQFVAKVPLSIFANVADLDVHTALSICTAWKTPPTDCASRFGCSSDLLLLNIVQTDTRTNSRHKPRC